MIKSLIDQLTQVLDDRFDIEAITPTLFWPGDLLQGAYRCARPRLPPDSMESLSVGEYQGGPYFMHGGYTLWLKQMTLEAQDGRIRLEVQRDDGSGSLARDTLWMRVHERDSFTLTDAQGRENRYRRISPEQG